MIRQWLRAKYAGALVLVVAASVLLAALTARLMPAENAQAPRPQTDERDIAGYAGDEACRSCHSAAFADHQASNHHRALRGVSREELGALCPSPGRIPDSPYSFLEQEGKYFFSVDTAATGKPQTWPLDYAFGSGKTGITFVSMLEGRNIVEMKMSYFPATRTWKATPGQTLDHPEFAGRTRDLTQSRRCFECHSVAVSRNAFLPRKEFMGDGCESCHGPARAHAEARRSGTPLPPMQSLASLGARALNDRCGACHSTAKDIARTNSEISAKMTYRFQPYGIMQSRCFRDG